MSNEEYIFKKLEKLSPVDKILSDKIVKSLGKEWATPKEVADYLGRHINTIYEKINNDMHNIIFLFFCCILFLLSCSITQ